MKRMLPLLVSVILTAAASAGEWIEMFNGKDLAGWKVSTENPGSFQVKDGMLVIDGPRAHLFYAGPDGKAAMRDFEFEAMVKTFPSANSGVFFHTQWQEKGWPAHGYEAQVNATHKDPRKTGSVYAVKDVMFNAPHKDGEWFKYTIRVEGKRIVIKVNDKVVNDYTEPEDPGHKTRKLGEGTIAIQAHDPQSVVHYKDLRYRALP
ncbi:MAG TPA: DUF1080 domain-containing protein [Luteolibacter sp.]|nr:DUF1080 domain-containing protein [Luteolibacter sp.]